MRILILEDDELFSDQLATALRVKDHFVAEANCLKSGLKEFESKKFDVILLDLQLGSESGLDFLKIMDHFNYKPFVVMITSHASKTTAISAINLGVNKFLEKPFRLSELKKILEDCESGNNTSNFVLNPETQSVVVNSQEVLLTEIEYSIVNLLIQNANSLVTKDEIHTHVYQSDIRSKNSLNTHLTNLKRKLPSTFAKDLRAIRGKGYIYENHS